MEKIKLIMDELDIREVCLSVTHDYCSDNTKYTIDEETKDIVITINNETFIDKIYGREIQGKYYYARHQIIDLNPSIDYYEEFFSTGRVIQ